MIKAIFFDVDGTLVSFQTHRMSDTLLDALTQVQKKGIRLFLSTGRHPLMLPEVNAAFPFDGQVMLNGQLCMMDGRTLRSNPVSPEHVAAVVEAAVVLDFPMIVLAEGEMYMNHTAPVVEQFLDETNLKDIPSYPPSRALNQVVYQIIVFLSKEEEHLLRDRAPELSSTRWNPTFLDVIPTGGGKDVGIQAVMDHLGIHRDEVMAFGDGENDLSMIRHAGTGVAMGSGTDYLKSQADYVTGTVDEDGVVTALRHFGLI